MSLFGTISTSLSWESFSVFVNSVLPARISIVKDFCYESTFFFFLLLAETILKILTNLKSSTVE